MREMRVAAPIFVWFAALACCCAQDYTQSEMYKRWDTTRNKAMAAVNAYSTGDKKYKNDPSLAAAESNKQFEGGTLKLDKKVQGVNSFGMDQKYSPQGYKATRSFFGIKNPWFGSKTFSVDQANEGSKSLYDGGKKFKTDAANVKQAGDADKTMNTSNEVVELKPWLGNGNRQGSLSLVADKIKKELTVEEVRELLNKNR